MAERIDKLCEFSELNQNNYESCKGCERPDYYNCSRYKNQKNIEDIFNTLELSSYP
ncbi:MAG: hypothetical protein Q7R52_03835 [archaeon]|nr:hypothetical protein [archaeon]